MESGFSLLSILSLILVPALLPSFRVLPPLHSCGSSGVSITGLFPSDHRCSHVIRARPVGVSLPAIYLSTQKVDGAQTQVGMLTLLWKCPHLPWVQPSQGLVALFSVI